MNFSFSDAERRFADLAREFARTLVHPQAARIDETGAYPNGLVAEAAALGLLGVTAPREVGGAGQSYVAYAAALEEIAAASASLAVILVVHNSLVVDPLVEFGTPDQQRRWLPDLAAGRTLGAFALTEAQSGSDAAHLKTTATRDGEAFRLCGEKVWVTSGGAAGVAIVVAATRPADAGRGLTAFLVPLDAPGIRRTPSPDSLGVRGLDCVTMTLDDVCVGPEAVLGRVDEGFAVTKRALDGGRVAIAAQALGVGRAALEEAIGYSQRREAFGHPISVFQAIQFQLADRATDLEAARVLMWKAADLRDRGRSLTVEAAMAKLHASEAAHLAADRAMQILASEGYRRGSTIERLFRDIRAAEIYQGTSEVQRLIIARSLVG